MKRVSTIALACSMMGCAASLGGDGTDTTGGDVELALRSSSGEVNQLRRGESLALVAGRLAALDPQTTYRFNVTAPGGAVLSEGQVRTDLRGVIELATVMHDVGEDGRVAAGTTLSVSLLNNLDAIAGITSLTVSSVPSLQTPGWNVNEVQPPHIFAATAAGEPTNAYAVGGADPGEQVGPIHIAGEGFPRAAAGRDVDVYVVLDRDEWRDMDIPQNGDAGYVAGPIAVRVGDDGRIATTPVFNPSVGQVGVYDILVDVDRDGRFEWSFDSKDGADGLGRVGFTVQYSAAWLRARTSSHILVNIAYDSVERDNGSWLNIYRADQPVYLYLNPPVMHEYHFSVTKWIVRHQDFDAFWNNPAVAEDNGSVNFAEFAINSMQVPPQTGCTNSAPVGYGVIELPEGTEEGSFDVVFDRNGDGFYEPGVDMLDIVGVRTDGFLVSVEELTSLAPALRSGFTIRQ